MSDGKPRNYFDPHELWCPCCKQGGIDPLLHAMLNTAREHAGIPFVLTSAYRCPAHNKEVGGSTTSSHLKGFAVDISVPDSTTRFKVQEALFFAGFKRMEAGIDYIHVDIDPVKPSPVSSLNKKIMSLAA